MYIETTKSGQTFMVDISNVSNFVFGNTISDSKQKLYFIDFYPFYLGPVPQNGSTRILQDLLRFAEMFGGNNFPKTQALIQQLNQV
jgi:hypothetical protein